MPLFLETALAVSRDPYRMFHKAHFLDEEEDPELRELFHQATRLFGNTFAARVDNNTAATTTTTATAATTTTPAAFVSGLVAVGAIACAFMSILSRSTEEEG